METEVGAPPNDGTLFMFDDGFIPLPDLESWYAQGHVTPNDTVRIFEKDKKSYEMKISALIEMYGAEFPFRRIPKNPDGLKTSGNSGESETSEVKQPGPSITGRPIIISQDPTVIPKKVGGAFGSKRSVTPEAKEEEKVEKKEEFIYLDYPLYNVDNEPEVDRITGLEVLIEMEKLKVQFPYKRFSDRYTSFFWFINRKKVGDREEVAICRLCNYTPYSPRIFFNHLFNNYHIQELSKNQVSRKSFDYWSRQFDALKVTEKEDWDKKQAQELKEKEEESKMCLKKLENSEVKQKLEVPKSEIPTTTSEVKDSKVKVEKPPRIPLFDPPSSRNFAKVSQQEFVNFIKSLSKAMENVAAKAIANHKIVNWKCGYCSSNHKSVTVTTELDAFVHLVSQKHKEKMKFTAPPDDLLHWGNWAIEINKQIEKLQNPPGIQKISEDVAKIQEPPKPTVSVQKPSTSSSESSKKVPEKTQKAPSFASTIANNPRVPMLDQMPTNQNLVTKQKFNEILDQCAEMFQKDRKRLSAAKFEPKHWNCTYCSTEQKMMKPSNTQDVLLHITKHAHREMMQYKATLSDLMYWKTWAENYGIPQKVLEQKSLDQKKLAETQKPVEEKVVVKKPVKTSGAEKGNPFKKGFNNPRIPLLDVPKCANHMKHVHFKSRYQSLCNQLKTRKSGPETEKAVQCMCYHCPGDTRITTVYQMLQHIFNGQHDRYIQYSATSSDFLHHERIIQRMPFSPEFVAAAASPSAVVMKRTPVSVVNPLPQVAVSRREISTPSKPVPLSPAPKAVVPSKTVPPVPRIPSVNTAPSKTPPVPLPRFLLQGQVTPAPLPVTPAVSRVVPQAQTAPLPQTMQHTRITPAPVPVPPVTRVVPARTVTPAVRATPSSAPIRISCTLPLFGRRSPIQSRLNEWEPTNEQIAYVNREWRMRPGATSFFNNCTYCSLCNEDMSFWTLLEVVRHAFSVRHLKMYGRPGNIGQFPVASEGGYRFWIEKLQHSCVEAYTTMPSIPCVSRLGLRSHGPTNYNDVFTGFTANQKEIIANVDVDKLNACSYLLKNFGCCIYCNKWLLTGKEVYEHWMNDVHMAKIRQQHEVGQIALYKFVTYLGICQKEKNKSGCSIM